MSYLRKIEYKIVPEKSFPVVHNCSGCGSKARFINTKHFRVNANGNKIDVWLIYQCEKCRHTLNLSIYERQKANKIPQDEYQRFLGNDELLAEEYGRDAFFFRKNRLEIDSENISYAYVDAAGNRPEADSAISYREGDLLLVDNPYGLKIRPEKQAAQLLKISRSQVKRMLETGQLVIKQDGGKLEVWICGEGAV